jgi:hypothetical protein
VTYRPVARQRPGKNETTVIAKQQLRKCTTVLEPLLGNRNTIGSSVFNAQRYWVFGLCPSSGFFLNNNKKIRFGNWICFRPQVREDTYSVGFLRKS